MLRARVCGGCLGGALAARIGCGADAASEQLNELYEKMDAFSSEDKKRAAAVKALRDIGFTDELLARPTKELSGGWRTPPL